MTNDEKLRDEAEKVMKAKLDKHNVVITKMYVGYLYDAMTDFAKSQTVKEYHIDELNKVIAWWKEKCLQGFKDGYLKCEETNADKKYTEEDLHTVIRLRREWYSHTDKNVVRDFLKEINNK
jgi:hypothetical protein